MNSVAILEIIKEWVLQKFITSDTIAIILTGSSAKNQNVQINDIDIFILELNPREQFQRNQYYRLDIEIDIIKVDYNHFLLVLETPPKNLLDLEYISMLLNFISSNIVWYQHDDSFQHILERGRNWSWKPEYIKFVYYDCEEPKSMWAKSAYIDHMKLLNAIVKRIERNQTISHRRKDLSELETECSRERAQAVYDLLESARDELSIIREWTEWKTAQRSIRKRDWSRAIESLKDCLNWILRSCITGMPKDYFDPNMWIIAEQQEIPDIVLKALKAIYR